MSGPLLVRRGTGVGLFRGSWGCLWLLFAEKKKKGFDVVFFVVGVGFR